MTTLALMLLPALELHWMDRARAHELARQVARASWRPPTGAGGRVPAVGQSQFILSLSMSHSVSTRASR